jgi:adenosyl cobinamide kinase/adenosyl cobinamide phosphate guanylyltransferase
MSVASAMATAAHELILGGARSGKSRLAAASARVTMVGAGCQMSLKGAA